MTGTSLEDHKDKEKENVGSQLAWNRPTVSHDRTLSVIRTPFFTYDDIDRSGSISPLKIARYFQWSRVAAYFSSEFLTKDLGMYVNFRPFMTIAEYQINESLYSEVERWKTEGCLIPGLLKNKIVSAGRSTLDMMSSIESEHIQERLATLHYKMTVVDVKTRKSHPLPEDFKAELAKYRDNERVLGRFEPKSRPQGAFKWTQTIRPSDTDFNGHTNQGTYIQLCFDCASLASLKERYYKHFDGDVAMYRVKSMSMWYAGESMMGDTLVCYTWEDDVQPLMIHFQIELNGRTVYHNSVGFHVPNLKAKL